MSKKFFSLLLKSARLKAVIDAEQKRPMPDWARLFRLKRLRLYIKDRLAAFMQQQSRYQMQPIQIRNNSARSRS